MFTDVLTGVRDRVEGVLAVSLIGLDGIPIATVNDAALPLDVFGAEFGGFIRHVRPITELNTGEVQQFSLVTDTYTIFLSSVTPEYYVLLVLEPAGNYGRARFELAKAKELLRDELT